MKLKSSQVSKIAELIIKSFIEKKIATMTIKEEIIKKQISDIIINNLEMEEKLDQEVTEFLEQFRDKFSSGEIDYRKMFDLTKKKLANEKKFIL